MACLPVKEGGEGRESATSVRIEGMTVDATSTGTVTPNKLYLIIQALEELVQHILRGYDSVVEPFLF